MKWRIYALDSQVRREELISSASEVGPCRNHRVNSLTRRLEINLVKVVTKISKSTIRLVLPIHFWFLRKVGMHSIWQHLALRSPCVWPLTLESEMSCRAFSASLKTEGHPAGKRQELYLLHPQKEQRTQIKMYK